MDNIVKQAEDILLDSCQRELLDGQIEAEKALIDKLNEDIRKMYEFKLKAAVRLANFMKLRDEVKP